MTRAACSFAMVLWMGCVAPTASLPPPLRPAPAPPPGALTIWGPLEVEAIELSRMEIGWSRDFEKATRTVTLDVVLTQERATCSLQDATTAPRISDPERCEGVARFPAGCRPEPRMRARVEATVLLALDFHARCAGESAPYALAPTGDLRASLAAAGAGCFRTRNHMKPESSWTSIYELTEIELLERPIAVRTPFARLLARAMRHDLSLCRDDGAYLDGTPGRPEATMALAPVDDVQLATTLLQAAQLEGDRTPLTDHGFVSEHTLWEQCSAPNLREQPLVQQRCLLLRQFDRFLREVEDQARPETTAGSAQSTVGTGNTVGGASAASASASGAAR